MNTKTFITLTGMCLATLAAFFFYPSQSKAGSVNKFKIQPNLSVEAHKSDAVRVSESYEWIMARYIGSVENRVAKTERGIEKVSAKLDTIDGKIDDIARRLTAIEKALNIEQEIPKPN
ncbi:MAG: hypothetical protein FVQ82_12680 [Planctomycetes bacterium]|nr:hypothetical protein [Planctomycetota bacterium]